MRMKCFQNGARLDPSYAMAFLFAVLVSIEREYQCEFVLTSGREGVHQPGSYHYIGLATDWRIEQLGTFYDREACISELRQRLHEDFDVVSSAKYDRVFHVEFQPKHALSS